MSRGKVVYTQTCIKCHQVDGAGAPNMIPTLIKTGYVLGERAQLIKIVLDGLKGEIKVNGDTFGGEMPAQNELTDEEIASVLSYVRNSFGNTASPVSATIVKKVRAANAK